MAQLDILVTGIQKGIDKYYNEFYELTHQQAYSIALQMMKKEEDALDVLQDAYIKAYQKIESLENPEKLFSWFNMIVANTCRDYLKRKTPVLFNEIDTDEFEF